MTLTRRTALAALAAGTFAGLDAAASRTRAQAIAQWFPLVGDDGKPLVNMRLPVELTSEIEELPGVIWLGSERRDRMLVEVYDYNCPWCRKAVTDLGALMGARPDLRMGLLNNPILSAGSHEAARVELALSHLGRPASVYRFHERLFGKPGTIDGRRALDAAEEVGAPRAVVERLAASREVGEDLAAQMKLAANLGLSATPSFLIAGAGILGYPGPKALNRVMDAVERCDRIAC